MDSQQLPEPMLTTAPESAEALSSIPLIRTDLADSNGAAPPAHADGSGEIDLSFNIEIQEIVEAIHEGISTLSDSINSLGSFSISQALTTGIIAAAAAFLFNWLNWKIEKRNQAVESAGRTLIDMIKKLETQSIEYWLQDAAKINSTIRKSNEIFLKSGLTQIRSQSALLIRLGGWDANSKISVKLNAFLQEIFEKTTNGEFESGSRTSDPIRASGISSSCSKIMAEISNAIH